MIENQVSLTSLVTAYARAYHSVRVTPKIFDDFLAYDFFKPEERSAIEKNSVQLLNLLDPQLSATCPDQATALDWVMKLQVSPSILSRAKYTEDSLEKAITKGIKQYVILGAGMDTFAFRQAKLLEQLQVFEMDYPATQEFKQQRIRELGWKIPQQLHFIPIDFSQEQLAEKLKNSSYNPKSLTFFSWLGVTMYLTKEEIFQTLNSIAQISSPGSIVIFDYISEDQFVSPTKNLQLTKEITKNIGEPMKTAFNPDTLATELQKAGLQLQENLIPTDIENLYFQNRTDNYHASKHIHFAYAMVNGSF